MAEYIDKQAAIAAIKKDIMGGLNYESILKRIPAADVVSKTAYDQTAWERNLAEEQLKSIGKSLGKKMDDVQPVKHGRWKWSEGGQCSECGFHNSNFGYNYCPNCGTKMDGEK